MNRTYYDEDLDTQPEKDVPPSRMLSLSMGLLLGCGMILGTLLGALVGHFLLDDALGLGSEHDIWVGAIAGAIIVGVIAVVSVKALSARAADRDQHRSPVTH